MELAVNIPANDKEIYKKDLIHLKTRRLVVYCCYSNILISICRKMIFNKINFWIL